MPGASAAARRAHGLRNRVGGSFDQPCEIHSPNPAKVPNGAGGMVSGAPIVREGLFCEVRFPKASPQTPASQPIETTLSRVEIRLPVGTEISIRDRIVVGGLAYDVQGHDSGRSFASEILCDCVRADDGEADPDPNETP